MSDDQATVAVELERLRGTVEAGFARVDGSLALLVQRSDQSDKQLADHEQRLDALNAPAGRWQASASWPPWPRRRSPPCS
ncbi:hypothetical protein SFUMM280S_06574 [Streptomyces fumanus]